MWIFLTWFIRLRYDLQFRVWPLLNTHQLLINKITKSMVWLNVLKWPKMTLLTVFAVAVIPCSSAALVEDSRARCIQTISPRVQVSTQVHTCIPYWRALSGGRCRGSSATPFQFIFIIDCQLHPTPYRRWPSFPGCCCTCLEQSARSCHFRTFCSSLPVPA